jgi:phosphosulfolactate phosphohydrolase-like enzyme
MGEGCGRLSQAGSSPRIRFEWGAHGASRGAARGDLVLLIDALRASVTIMAALRAGAARVVPVGSVDAARAYQGRPGYLIAGERGGAKLPRFHYGNSPSEILAHASDVAGHVLVLTTSNGTQAVSAALGGATGLLAGSTVNATVAADALIQHASAHGCDITLVGAGLGEERSEEDDYAQRLIAGYLAERGALADQAFEPALASAGQHVFDGAKAAARLRRLGYAEDVRLCAQVDLWETVPIYRSDGFYLLSA